MKSQKINQQLDLEEDIEEEEKKCELQNNLGKEINLKSQKQMNGRLSSQYLLLNTPQKQTGDEYQTQQKTDQKQKYINDDNQLNQFLYPVDSNNNETQSIENMKAINMRKVISDFEDNEDIQSRRGLFRHNNILDELEIPDQTQNRHKKIIVQAVDYATFQQYIDHIDLININVEKLQKKHFLKDIFFIYLLQVNFANDKWMIRRTVEQIMNFEEQYIKCLKSLGFKEIEKQYLTLESLLDEDTKQNNPQVVMRHITENIKIIINQFQFNISGTDPLLENYNISDVTSKQVAIIQEFKLSLRAFLEFSDIFEEGKQKHKEVFVYKRAGGRHNQSLCDKLNCKNIFGCYDKRYFLISQEGVMYTKGLIHPLSTLREVILFDYNFNVKYGKNLTGYEFDILYALKTAYDSSIYGGVHRFNSFAPPRDQCLAKWYVDGQNYFQDACDAIESAQSEIFITDWWLSPEFYLKRPASKFPDSRIDKLLQKKANEGVLIYIIVYLEPEIALNISSKYTQSKLTSLHPTNINVVRHPKFLIPFMWSHHEKLIVIDQEVGFLGGFDLCYGRWDTQAHSLIDNEYPETKQLFNGIDYCNFRTKDIYNVQDIANSNLDRYSQPRMPWHDVALRILGLPVKDLAKHFIQYWNFSQIDIGNKGGNQGCLIPQEREGQKNMFKPYIKEFNQKLKGLKTKFEGYIKEKITKIKPDIQNYLNNHSISFDFINNLEETQNRKERSHVFENQTKTSFELMLLHEDKKPREEIIQLLQQLKQIKEDNIYDEFEEQSMISIDQFPSIGKLNESLESIQMSPTERGQIGTRQSLMSSVNQSKNEQHPQMTTRFSFYKSMFEKTIDGSLTNLQKQIQNTKNRLKLQAKKYKLSDKGNNSQQCQILRSASHWSLGLSKKDTETSIQIAYLTLINESKYFIYIENQFFISSHAGAPVRNQISVALVQRIKKAALNSEPFFVMVILPLLPGFEGEIDDDGSGVMKIQLHWEYQTICRGGSSILEDLKSDPNIPDPFKYIQFYGLRTHNIIKNKPVTEMVYVHSKMMIIDDQIAIIGSANINDRSLKGNRDSEIAAIIEDKELIASKMNGENYMASKFAHSLRCELYKEHFQIEQVSDPLNPSLIKQINNQALQNTLLYREIFRCYPDDEVKHTDELKQFVSQSQPNLYTLKAHYFKGNVVQWPLKFLENENMKFQIHMKEFYCPDINFT